MHTSADCEICGKKLTLHRLGRARRFCSSRCRQAAFRNAQFKKKLVSINWPGVLRNSSEKPTNSNGCKSKNGDRGFDVSLPRNILGGYRWPTAAVIKPATLQAIIRAEIGDAFFDAASIAPIFAGTAP
jgi:endogenous inhibitor of DNA gyrase (YacG/DUF329 family)